MTKTSKVMHLIAPIPDDFCNTCEKFIPPWTELRFEFVLHDPDFALITMVTKSFKFVVEKMQLQIRRVEVAPALTMESFKARTKVPFLLNYRYHEIQTFSIAANKNSEFINGIFRDKNMSQLFVWLVETDRANGVQNKDPMKFEHGNVEKMILKRGGSPVMVDSQESDFASKNGMHVLYLFQQALNVGSSNRTADIDSEKFHAGSTVWSWTMAPDMDNFNGMNMPDEPGNFDLDIYVKPGTTNPGLTVFVMGVFCGSVLIADDNITTVL